MALDPGNKYPDPVEDAPEIDRHDVIPVRLIHRVAGASGSVAAA